MSSPDFHLGNMGLDLGIPGTNDQGRGDPRYAGMPQFSPGFTALGNTPAWSPIYREEYSDSFNTNLTKVAGRRGQGRRLSTSPWTRSSRLSRHP